MKSTTLIKRKAIAVLLCSVLLMNVLGVLPPGIMVSATDKPPDPTPVTDTGQTDDPNKPTTIPQSVTIVTKNPNDVKVNVRYYPIFTSSRYDSLKFSGLMTGYETRLIEQEGVSPYYTAGISQWYDYWMSESLGEGASITSSLPYREARENMLNPTLTLTNASISVTPYDFRYSDEYRDLLGSYVTNTVRLDKTQVYLRAGATVLQGKGEVVIVSNNGGHGFYRAYHAAQDGKAQDIYVDMPLSELCTWTSVNYSTYTDYYTPTSMMTGTHLALIDDTSPSLNHVKISREEVEDGTTDLVLTMTYNEGIRFSSEGVANLLDDIWVEVELVNLQNNSKTTARLHIADLNSQGTLTFRGNIGFYGYNNFRVNRITRANIPTHQSGGFESGFVDLVDGMYISAYEKQDYGNRIFNTKYVYGNYDYSLMSPTVITDYAGNPVSAAGMTNWRFGDQTFISNSFEAVDVQIYNDEAGVGRPSDGEEDEEKKYQRSDLFVGTTDSFSAYVYLNVELTAEEAAAVYATFNILNEDGTPLTVKTTASYNYTIDEIYATGERTGTVLCFEGIQLKEGMTADIPIGKSPDLKITELSDEIPDKTAYPNVKAPSTTLYADLTPPETGVRKVGGGEVEQEKVHYATIEITAKDVANYTEISGMVDTKLSVSLGGGVNKDTVVRYLLSADQATPPEEKLRENYPSELLLSPNGMVTAKFTLKDGNTTSSYPVIAEEAKFYLHLYIEGDGLLLDDLFVGVQTEDVAGNMTDIDPPEHIEYFIDEIPPNVHFTGIQREGIVVNGKGRINITLNVSATDYVNVDSMLYYIGENPNSEDAEWQVLQIEAGKTVTGMIEKQYGNDTDADDTLYSDIVWVKAIDEYGNESDPVSRQVVLSTQKPVTDTQALTDLNKVSTEHKIIVTGAPPSEFDGQTAYTRVYLTPVDNPTYSYVTMVKTGETANVLGFEGLTWYRVKVSAADQFTEVSEAETVGKGYTLTENSILYDLFTYYGEVKVSFENGYAASEPIPVRNDYRYTAFDAGSYIADANYYVARYVSPYYTGATVHSVDFDAIISRDDMTLVANADKGAAAYLFKADRKGINPMRGTQIHFSLSNILKASYGLLDFDYGASFAELVRHDADGSTVTVVRQSGLSAAASQYVTVPNTDDNGDYFKSGAYYLRVTVVSLSGRQDVYESSRLVLDAETADGAGVWQYSRQTVANITSNEDDRIAWKTEMAVDKAFTDIGVSVTVGGERMRSSLFAVYSYGSTALSIILKSPESAYTLEGFTIGGIEGFKVWNMASEPDDEQLAATPFRQDMDRGFLSRIADLDDIYDESNLPRGADSFGGLYLMKGVNVIAYQYKMTNGYVSPIRYFTVTVTDYTPELNIAVDDYRISHDAPDIDGMINAHSVRFFVETAYSLNGTGRVTVDLWSDYGMNVGCRDGSGELQESFLEDPTPWGDGLGVLVSDLKVEDFADFTENSYTSDFPRYTKLCTAVFVATDEYGGVTLVAPQLGDHVRYGTVTGSELDNVYNIDYEGTYFGDPYVVGDSFTSWRITYNEPQYFGARVKSFETYLRRNTEDGEVKDRVLMESNTEIQYNLFNIVTNDVTLGLPASHSSGNSSYMTIYFDKTQNLDLVLMDSSTVTFSGGDLSEPVTVNLEGGDNTIGYMGGSISGDRLSFNIANPRADGSHNVGDKVTRSFTLTCVNRFGDTYTATGNVTLTYINYTASATHSEQGIILNLSFVAKDYGTSVRTGGYNIVSDGRYELEDLYGNVFDATYSISSDYDDGTTIRFPAEPKDTAKPVTVIISRADGAAIYVDVTDYELMSVSGSGTSSVEVTIYGNTRFSYRYRQSNGNEKMVMITVDHIKKPSPVAVWDYAEDDYTVSADGVAYRYGTVTVYLTDNSFKLIDRYTGLMPTYTFEPGGPAVHVFEAENLLAVLGDETVELEQDIVVKLPITLYEIPDISGKNAKDEETPNVQVLAYKLDGSFNNVRLALQLENARNSAALTDYYGYTVYGYVGSRASMSSLLKEIGWTPAARFEIEILDMSRVRLFIKEGLYATAPDFDTGESDEIPGVTLNSKLLTVTASAKFTLFVVDSHNNASAVVFDTSDIGQAPSPTFVKVTKTDGDDMYVRTYILPPEGSADFKLLGITDYGVESEGEYAGQLYVDYSENDDYELRYSFLFGEVSVSGGLDINVSEIKLMEIEQVGGVEWSANKADEATARNVIATVTFSEEVHTMIAQMDYDKNAVTFTVSGNFVTAVYQDNHPEIKLACSDAYGNTVYVTLDEVTNINRNAPTVEQASRELAADGRSVEITFVSSDRVMLGGFFGEQRADGRYYFTRRIAENGEFSYTFVNVVGLMTTVTFTVDELVLTPISALYSLVPDGAGAVEDVAMLDIDVGDSFFIKVNREATLALCGGEGITLPEGEWIQLTLPEGTAGTRPYLVLTDTFGNVLTQQFSKVPIPDTSAPEILINHSTFSVRVGTELEEVRRQLLENFTALDDGEGELTYDVSFTADMQSIGMFTVEYKATDSAGNSATAVGRLRVTSLNEPVVHYGDSKLFRDGSLVLSEGTEVTLTVDSSKLAYKVILADGINTVAQIKTYGETVCDYGTQNTVEIGKLDAGIYTVVLLTQERDYFILYIAIVEPE